MGADVPQFAHVPLILGPDKKRLSKRHGATSVMEYAAQGYLPEAMVNFLALLGWSPGSGDRELFTRSELTDVFDVRGISGGNAVFNPEKLDWFNQQHLLLLAPDELARRIRPSFEAAGVWDISYLGDRHAWFFAVLELLKPRAKKLDEFVSLGWFFFSDALQYDTAAVDKHLRPAGMDEHLRAADAALMPLPTFDAATIESTVRATADERGVKAATLIHALRVAVTGKTVSPGLFDVLALLGRERTHARVRHAVALISAARG
jgi:glutamyl-tRNA synthetase